MQVRAPFITFLLLLLAIAIPAGWLARRRRKPSGRFVDRLDIDDVGFSYTAIETYPEGARWKDVHRVLFYHGEPDFPDPLAGMAPIAEWIFVSFPEYRSAHVPHSPRHTARLADACAKHLPGFDLATLRDASRLEREGHWLLWESTRTSASSDPVP